MGNAPNIPYNIAGNVPSYNDQSGWTLHTGTKKATSEPVSIFKIKLEGLSSSRKEACTNAFNRIKTIRHPNVLKFLDGIESDKEILIVTETIKPLADWLKVAKEVNSAEQFEAALAWGLRCICSALQFLANDCKLLHGMVSKDSIFVTEGGDWKLGRLDLVASMNKNGPDTVFTYNNELLPQQYRSPERLQRNWTAIADNPIWTTDAWSYGCLIYEVFNGRLLRPEETQDMESIPSALRKVLQRLLASKPRQRPNPKRLLSIPFFDRELVQTLTFLDEMAVKEPDDKRIFFQQLPSKLNTIPAHVCIHKILPSLKSAMATLPPSNLVVPMLSIGKMINDDDLDTYNTCVMPNLIEFYKMNDRGVRALLLQNIDSYKHALEYKKNGKGDNILNKEIFTHMITGFKDSAPQMREITLKTMPSIVDMLNKKHLNTTLGNVLKHLLSDPVPGIRVNATILLGLIAEKFDNATRSKLLLPGFTQALNDPFYHNRAVALKALGSTHRMYDAKDACSKILPHVVCRLVDDVHAVRQPAFACLAQFVKRLEAVSDEMGIVEAEKRKEEERKRAEEARLAKEQEDLEQSAPRNSGGAGNYGGMGTSNVGGSNTVSKPNGNAIKSTNDVGWGDDDDDDFFGGASTSLAKSSRLKPKSMKVSKLDLKRNKANTNVDKRMSKTRLNGSRRSSKGKSSTENDSFWGDEDDDLFGDMGNSLSNAKKNTDKVGSKKSSSKLRTSHRQENPKKKIAATPSIGSNDAWGDDDDDLFSSPPKVKLEKPARAKKEKTKTVNESAGWGDEGDDMFADLLSDTSFQQIPTKKKVNGGIKLKVSHNPTPRQKQASKSSKPASMKSKKKAQKKVDLGDKDDFFGDFGF